MGLKKKVLDYSSSMRVKEALTQIPDIQASVKRNLAIHNEQNQ